MKLKSRKGKLNGQSRLEIYFYGRWRTLDNISKHPSLKERNLTPDVLHHRWRAGCLTEERLVRKVNKKKKDSKPRECWLYEGCSPGQIAALKTGTNHALLSV